LARPGASTRSLARPIHPTGDAVPPDLLGEARAKLAVLLNIA
jgi:hypothetical protein